MDLLNNFKILAREGKIRTDNNVFKLHYKFSVGLLLFFALLLSSKQYFGDPIVCDVEFNKDIVDTFCWITGTFIIVDDNGNDGFRGLGNAAGKRTFTLLFYQWMCLLFCLQALLFYIPRYLWKTWEGNRLGYILQDLCGPFISDKWTPEHKENIKTFILENPSNHNIIAYRFAFCELLNLCNLILQIHLMNWYLEGRFSLYGYHAVTKPWPEAYDAVFPKRTKCTYSKYGPSGSLVSWDALCVLPLNILNEKFFFILWFWMIFLFIVTIGALIYRAMVMFWLQFRMYILMAQVRNFSYEKSRMIVKHLSHGQFFLLFNLGKHINPIIYKDFLMVVLEHFEGSDQTFVLESTYSL